MLIEAEIKPCYIFQLLQLKLRDRKYDKAQQQMNKEVGDSEQDFSHQIPCKGHNLKVKLSAAQGLVNDVNKTDSPFINGLFQAW